MARKVSVLGFGDNVVDIYEHTGTMYPGGNAVNFAVAAKRCGAERSAYMGYFGSDAAAEHVITSLEEEGIELIKCKQLLGPNGAARVTLVDGDRVFLGSNGGGIRGETSYVLDRFDLAYIKQFDVVHTGNYCFTERQLPKIHNAGVPISFDFSDDSSWEYYEQIAPLVDFAFMSCSEMSEQETIEHLHRVVELGPRYANATRGAEGAIGFDGERLYRQAPAPVEHLVDTMAAGDTFLTGFIVSWFDLTKQGVEGSDRIEQSLAFAATAAARACESDGSWGHGAPVA
jgi:sugar/nucleoside kinase (ribokinase family)